MNIVITTFDNPFSFFCLVESDNKEITSLQYKVDTGNAFHNKPQMSDSNHGQYVAVMWKNKWARGIVSLKSQFLIWLIDHGIYIRPNEKTVYMNLPTEYKKIPSKLFEASIHGVVPIDKILTEDCQIMNSITNEWNTGAITKIQSLIESALKIYFVPIALLSTQHNDIVLGDLYIKTEEKKIINVIEELEVWPVFLEKNKQVYIQNIKKYYLNRRHHRSCVLKPDIPDLSTLTTETTLDEYNAICAKVVQFEISSDCSSLQGDGSTVVGYSRKKEKYKLTPSEIEKYSKMYITICGREYNVLNVLLNKIKDLSMCERYKDHDIKSIGRGVRPRHLSTL
ncbi:LOW QUALITY PROTEIN: uncharacterized protein ACR2FA_003180 [Aphomia sociella]